MASSVGMSNASAPSGVTVSRSVSTAIDGSSNGSHDDRAEMYRERAAAASALAYTRPIGTPRRPSVRATPSPGKTPGSPRTIPTGGLPTRSVSHFRDHHRDAAARERAGGVHIIDVLQDEFEVVELARSAEVRAALAAPDPIEGKVAVCARHAHRLSVPSVIGAERASKPGRADRVLDTKLVGRGGEDRHVCGLPNGRR